ncbi:dihydrofolate reductase [Actinomortierella ambigua]|nr:dihydrofolate reductase [Actinomortierella ambigua]
MAATTSLVNPRAFAIAVAADLAGGIGKQGDLPFTLRKDLALFAKLTSKIPPQAQDPAYQLANACIMGRKTWESLPQKYRPLPNRFNIIVSRNPHYLDGKPEKDNPLVSLMSSFEAALDLVVDINDKSKQQANPSHKNLRIPRTFLMGGAQLYDIGVQSPHLNYVFLTRVYTVVEETDVYFPDIEKMGFELMPREKGHDFIESYIQEPVQGGIIEEGEYKYEFTVYTRNE